jgi:hypothetical protein
MFESQQHKGPAPAPITPQHTDKTEVYKSVMQELNKQ